jgi:hypothetical protein
VIYRGFQRCSWLAILLQLMRVTVEASTSSISATLMLSMPPTLIACHATRLPKFDATLFAFKREAWREQIHTLALRQTPHAFDAAAN